MPGNVKNMVDITTIINSEEAIASLWNNEGISESNASKISNNTLLLDSEISKNSWKALSPIETIADCYVQEAYYARWHNTSESDLKLRLAFSILYWSIEFEQQVRKEQKWEDDIELYSFWTIIEWQGIAAASGDTWFVDRLAHYLKRFLHADIAFEHMLTHDEIGRRFLALLQDIIISQQWPGNVNNNLGEFGELINTSGDSRAFESALVGFCDYRIAQSQGYLSADRKVKRKLGKTWSIYEDIGLSSIWPTELFILQYAYQLATGNKLSLEAPHPLLQSNLMKLPFPKLTPLQESDTIDKVKSFGSKLYGDNWNPYINKVQHE